MKRILRKILVMGICACVFLTACGASGENAEADPKEAAAETEKKYRVSFRDLERECGEIQDAALLGETLFFTAADGEAGDGAVKKLFRMDTDGVITDGLKEQKDTQSAAALGAAPDGSLKLIVSEEEKNAPVRYGLLTLSEDGGVQTEVDISDCFPGQTGQGVHKLAADSGGNIYAINEGGLKAINPEGKLLFEVDGIRPYDIVRVGENGIAVMYLGSGRFRMGMLDTENEVLEEDQRAGEFWDGAFGFLQGGGEELVYFSGDRVYSLGGEDRPSPLFSLLDYEISSETVSAFFQRQNGNFTFLTQSGTKGQLAELNRPDAGEASGAAVTENKSAEKTELVLGLLQASYAIKRDVVEFNKNNDKYHIAIRDYLEEYGIDEGEKRLQLDVISGNAPDIILLRSMEDSRPLIDKGAFEDLTPWLEADPELREQDYLENIMNLLKWEGRLYAVAPSFIIKTLVGKESIVGNRGSWTLSDIIELTQTTGKDQRLFGEGVIKNNLLKLFTADMEAYIDWETGKCTFDGEEFIQLLEFVNENAPDEYPTNYDYLDRAISDLREDRIILKDVMLHSVPEILVYDDVFGDKVNYIGYPTQEGCGSRVWFYFHYAISAASDEEKKAGAWQFIRTYLTKEYQENMEEKFGIPVMEEVLAQKYREMMTPEYVTGEDGTQVEKSKFSIEFGRESFEVYSASPEEIEMADSLIRRVDSQHEYVSLFEDDIIEAEAQAYFSGAKTAADTANVIQRRMQIYVNENR